jgi:hypothetical protein
VPTSKSENSSPSFRVKKEVICNTTRTLEGETYPDYPSLKNIIGAPGKKLKTPTTRAQRIKTFPKPLQMSKFQCRVKQQDNHSPSKANSATKDLNICIEEELLNNEFQKTIVKVINNLKEETQKLVFDLKEEGSKQLNKLK